MATSEKLRPRALNPTEDCLARVTARIQVLITAAKEMQERLPKDEQYIHASDVEATLQDLLYLARGRKPVLEET